VVLGSGASWCFVGLRGVWQCLAVSTGCVCVCVYVYVCVSVSSQCLVLVMRSDDVQQCLLYCSDMFGRFYPKL